MFGMRDPRLSPMNGRPGWLNPGPVAPVQLTPGFRPPGAGGGGLPGMMPEQQMPMPQMGGMMPFSMLRGPGQDETIVNARNEQAGTSDPMAQGAAQAADMGGAGSFASWLRGLF